MFLGLRAQEQGRGRLAWLAVAVTACLMGGLQTAGPVITSALQVKYGANLQNTRFIKESFQMWMMSLVMSQERPEERAVHVAAYNLLLPATHFSRDN